MGYRSRRKEKIATVVRSAIDKTIVVKVEQTTKHPVYKRIIKRSDKLMVHDEEKKAKAGDMIVIRETRPLSKRKRWRLVRII